MLEPHAPWGQWCASRRPSVGSPQPLERGNIPKNATKRPRLAKLVVELEPAELDDDVVKFARCSMREFVRELQAEFLDLAEETVVFPHRQLEQIAQEAGNLAVVAKEREKSRSCSRKCSASSDEDGIARLPAFL